MHREPRTATSLDTLRALCAGIDFSGQVLTVCGPCSPAELGVVMPHEHLFIDTSTAIATPERRAASRYRFPETAAEYRVWEQPFCACRRSALTDRLFGANRDALILASVPDAIAEVTAFKEAGGGTVVDVTTEGIGRSPLELRQVSAATGVKIVMGAGYYRRAYHPDSVERLSLEDLAAVMIRSIVQGTDNTNVRAGIIGELGAEDIDGPDETAEIRILRAAVLAARMTGSAITLHNQIGRPEKWPLALDILESAQMPLERVVAGHITGVGPDRVEKLLRRGVLVEFDTLGFPFMVSTPQVDNRPNLATILELTKRGYAAQILLSQDVCTKHQLHKYGGAGYDFVLTDVLPHLSQQGVSDSDIDLMVRKNPARLLTFAPPEVL